MNGKKREDIKRGLKVNIVLKKDQKSGKLTGGIVKDILTNSSFHPHGIKIRLENTDLEEFRRYLSDNTFYRR